METSDRSRYRWMCPASGSKRSEVNGDHRATDKTEVDRDRPGSASKHLTLVQREDLQPGHRRRSSKRGTSAEEDRKDRRQDETTDDARTEAEHRRTVTERRRMVEEPVGAVGGAEPREEESHSDERRRTRDPDVRQRSRT